MQTGLSLYVSTQDPVFPTMVDDYGTSVVGGRRERVGLYAWSGNGSWRSKGGTSKTSVALYLLTDFTYSG